MRKCIKDETSPTGWSLEFIAPDLKYPDILETASYQEFDKRVVEYKKELASYKSDRIPCSGFSEGEEVEKWEMRELRTLDLMTSSTAERVYQIAVPIKDLVTGVKEYMETQGAKLLDGLNEAARKDLDGTGSSNSISQVVSHSCTPEQKAAELVQKFVGYCDGEAEREWFEIGSSYKHEIANENAKQCALICVEEILKGVKKYEYGQGEKVETDIYSYWQQVKEAIITKL